MKTRIKTTPSSEATRLLALELAVKILIRQSPMASQELKEIAQEISATPCGYRLKSKLRLLSQFAGALLKKEDGSLAAITYKKALPLLESSLSPDGGSPMH